MLMETFLIPFCIVLKYIAIGQHKLLKENNCLEILVLYVNLQARNQVHFQEFGRYFHVQVQNYPGILIQKIEIK